MEGPRKSAYAAMGGPGTVPGQGAEEGSLDAEEDSQRRL